MGFYQFSPSPLSTQSLATILTGGVIEEHSSRLLLPIPCAENDKRNNISKLSQVSLLSRLNMWKIQPPVTSGPVSKSNGNHPRNTQLEKLP